MKSPTSLSVALHELSLYNTGRMSPEQTIAAFIARRTTLDHLLLDLGKEKASSRAQHHLIVGQRGMGKTMLLARIAAELQQNKEFNHRFIPLVFAEEQYAVDRLSKFWLNCLDSLADARERLNDQEGVRVIDDVVDQFATNQLRAAKNDQHFADEVYAAFEKILRSSNQRPVLLVDNLQLVFERLDSAQQHSFRELLMRPGAPIMVSASPTPPAPTQDYGAAFYDHFKVHYLRPLEEGEMRDLLTGLAERANRPDVRERVLRHPARTKILRQLTGGNPRTVLTLFFLYAEDFAPSVFGDLEGLLDRVTPLYKARFEELSTQQQVVVSAIANHWDPVTSAQLVAASALSASTISAQLSRLEQTGVIERVEIHGESRIGYQLSERFFNIWFLMRSASRRQRREVEFLTRFLESFYEPQERSRLARHLMAEERFSLDRHLWCQAVAASLAEMEAAKDLTRHSELLALRETEATARQRLREILDLDTLPPATIEFGKLDQKLISLMPHDGNESPENLAKKILGTRQFFRDGSCLRFASKSEPFSVNELKEILDQTEALRKEDIAEFGEEAVAWFSHRLASGQIRRLDDAEDWNRAFHIVENPECVRLMVDTLPWRTDWEIDEKSYRKIASVIKPALNEQKALKWIRWGHWAGTKLKQEKEAKESLQTAIKIDPNSSLAWLSLAHLNHHFLKKPEEALIAYENAIQIKPDDSDAWIGKALLLHRKLRSPNEAEKAYRRAFEIDSNPDCFPLTEFGKLLEHNLKDYNEAEKFYRRATENHPAEIGGWLSLGELLAHHSQRFSEAISAFERAHELDPKDARPLAQIGYCYWFIDSEKAEISLKDALQCERNLELAWAFWGLHLSFIKSDPAEAEAAFKHLIEIDPSLPIGWDALGQMWANYNDRHEEAEAALNKATELGSQNPKTWKTFGTLLARKPHRYPEALEKYEHALELEPSDEETLSEILFVQRDLLGEIESARNLFQEKLQKGADPDEQPSISPLLHAALFAAYDANWGICRDNLVAALELSPDGFDLNEANDWNRSSAVLLHLNYGNELHQLIGDHGFEARLRPWSEAIRAHNFGNRKQLQNIAPEIRTTAEEFYDAIAEFLNRLPKATARKPQPTPRKRAKRR